jgi:hypothetical protein
MLRSLVLTVWQRRANTIRLRNYLKYIDVFRLLLLCSCCIDCLASRQGSQYNTNSANIIYISSVDILATPYHARNLHYIIPYIIMTTQPIHLHRRSNLKISIFTVWQLYNESEVTEKNWNKRLEYYLYFIQSTSLLHLYSKWHDLAKTGTTSARLLVVWPEDSMSHLLGCLEHLQRGTLSMVTSVWGTEYNHRVINQGSRADD